MDAEPPSGRRPPPSRNKPDDPVGLSSLDSVPGKDAYSVGKGRPPRHTQFKSGNSGGPGRPKGSKNRATLFEQAFDTPRSVTIEGRKCKMTAQELGYQQLSRQVARGDLKAIALSETIRNHLFPSDHDDQPVEQPLTEAEIAILRRRRHD